MPEPAAGLSRAIHLVRHVAFGDRTDYDGTTLTVDRDAAVAGLASPALERIDLSWASPGQPVRIVKVLDAVEPRTKGPGGGGIFPGFVGPPRPQGRGITHVLRGMAVVAAGFLPRAQEAVVEMSGPVAGLSPLGATHNLVVTFTKAPGASWEEVDLALRRGLLALAAGLAEAALQVEPDTVEELPAQLPLAAGGLPRVGAVVNLQTQGTFKDVFVHGRSFAGSWPTLLDANELDDGAVVSGQFGHPALKNPTFLHQNNPVVAALRARHDVDLRFAGVVICPEPVDQDSKAATAAVTARLCALAGFDAAVITKEGGGNADADIALKMDELDDLGIVAVGLFAEMPGPDGTGPSIVVPPSRATAMISTGNYDDPVVLPEVERALGGDTVDLVDLPATNELTLPTAVIYCSLSPLGWSSLRCQDAA
ncbi:MAG TPA: glycine/sarcosine/betaine reductase component B subunit [Acidimicrobiales bacterium]|nr:glycine/sarcosine/betaine reductase component B subunit [Acidimicrobiales bacterium]